MKGKDKSYSENTTDNLNKLDIYYEEIPSQEEESRN